MSSSLAMSMFAPAEAGEVAVADMGADRDLVCLCLAQRPQDACRVAGVEAAGDVGAGDDAEHRLVVPHLPRAEALAQVAVQVDDSHGSASYMLRKAKIGPIDLKPMYQVTAQTMIPRTSSQCG